MQALWVFPNSCQTLTAVKLPSVTPGYHTEMFSTLKVVATILGSPSRSVEPTFKDGEKMRIQPNFCEGESKRAQWTYLFFPNEPSLPLPFRAQRLLEMQLPGSCASVKIRWSQALIALHTLPSLPSSPTLLRSCQVWTDSHSSLTTWIRGPWVRTWVPGASLNSLPQHLATFMSNGKSKRGGPPWSGLGGGRWSWVWARVCAAFPWFW